MFPQFSIWPAAKPNEIHHSHIAFSKDVCIFILMIWSFFQMAQTAETLSPEHQTAVFSWNQKAGSLLAAIAMVITFVSDIFLLPYPTPDQPKWQTVSIIGHCGFFTLQTLFLQTSYALVKAYAIYTGNAKLCVVCCSMALWVNTQGAALTLLFFKLNWYEPKWQRDIQKPNEKKYPGISFVWLVGHVPSLPIALFDVVFLNNAAVVAVHGAEYMTVVKVAFVYGALYLLFAKSVQSKYGTLIYPFIKDISSPVKGFGFVVIVGSAVSVVAYGLNMLLLQ